MMEFGRRAFLKAGLSAGLAAVPARSLFAADTMPLLRAAPTLARLAPEGYPMTPVWAYDGSVPGPELRVRQGERLRRRLVNDLPQPTAVHWHGVRIDNAMDGVPMLTQNAVEPGETFDYDFVLPDAGTYWYHTHDRSWEQLARGLGGPLVVDEPDVPDIDADLVLAINDWRFNRDGTMAEDFGAMHDMAHAGRIGNFLTVNGAFELRTEVRRNQRLRLRLINMATARIVSLGFEGMEGWVVALDGMPLDAPQPLGEIVLAPAQRADVFVDVTAEAGGEAILIQYERDGGYALASFPVSEGSATRRDAPATLPPNPLPALDLSGARSLDLRMEGGAMRGLPNGAKFEGKSLSMRDLMQAGQVWALNGVAGMADAPLFILSRGEAIRIPLVNDTAFPHGIHTHGQHFREVLPGGSLGPWRDTILVDPGQTREIAMVGDNPGNWLLHCHMLGHQAAGMKTWFQVA